MYTYICVHKLILLESRDEGAWIEEQKDPLNRDYLVCFGSRL